MKDYCKQLFGKSIQDLNYEDISNFFLEEREESTTLEFKSGQNSELAFEDVLKRKIIKSICGFLNSEGGVIIWGTPKEVKKEKSQSKYRVATGELLPNSSFIEKDTLIRKIVSNISYLPTGIKLAALNDGEKYLYIIEVQESQSKPHQYDNQYPIRIDGQTISAPHYLIDAMFKTIKLPELDGRIDFLSAEVEEGHHIIIKFAVIIFNKSIFINEKNLSFQILATPGYFIINRQGSYISQPHEVLHYGRPYRETHSLYIPKQNLTGINNIKMILSFGGELGPALTNSYTISINKLKTGKFDFSNHVVEMTENESYKEVQEKLGITHEDSLKKILNRDS